MHAAVVQLVAFRQTETQTTLVEHIFWLLSADHFHALDSMNLCTLYMLCQPFQVVSTILDIMQLYTLGDVCGQKKRELC